MSTFARDVRIQAFHEVGTKIDDALELARLETARREGAHAAYANAARNVLGLLKTAAESGNAEIATAWVKKCAAACESLATQAIPLVHAAKGAEKQAESLVAALKQIYDLELTKKNRETEPLPPPAEDAPALPVRPRTLKEERLAYEHANSKQIKTENPPTKRGRKPKIIEAVPVKNKPGRKPKVS